jgi:hypothetical protein
MAEQTKTVAQQVEEYVLKAEAKINARIDALITRFEDGENRSIAHMNLMTEAMEVIKGSVASRAGAMAERNPAYPLYLKYDAARKAALAAGVATNAEKFIYPGVVLNIRNTSPEDQPITVFDANGKPKKTPLPQYVVHMAPPDKIMKDMFVMHLPDEAHGVRRSREFIEGIINNLEEATTAVKSKGGVSIFNDTIEDDDTETGDIPLG